MSIISKVSALLEGAQRQVDLSANTLQVNALQVGSSSTITSAIAAVLVNLPSVTPTSAGSTSVGDDNSYTNFTPTAATVKGALQGIDTALATAGSGANVTLSNLSSPTAINQNLLPGSTNSMVLGGSSNVWNSLWVNEIIAPGQIDFQLTTGKMFNNTGSAVADFNNTILADNSAANSINWTSRLLIDTVGTTQLSWSASGVKLNPLTASSALVLDGSSNIVASSTTAVEIGYVHGVTSAIQTQLDAKINTSLIGAANGVASLDSGGKVPVAQLPSTLMLYLGAWDASTNTPTLVDGTGTNGDVYRTSVAGTQNLGSGSQTFAVGDFVIYNGTIWQHSPGADGVSSVNGSTGAVVVNAINQLTGDVTASAAVASQSKATTVAAIQGTTVSGTTGSGNVVFSASPTVTGTLTAATITASGPVTGSNLSGTNTGDQTITLTGDVAGTGTGSFATTIGAGAVTASKLGTVTDGITLDQSGAGATLEIKAAGVSAAQLATGAFDQVTIVGGAGTPASVVGSSKIASSEISGQSLSATTPVALRYALASDSGSTAGQMWKADTDTTTHDNFYVVGLAYPPSAVIAGGAITVTEFGIMNVPSHGFVTGAPIFLAASGALTSTAPSAAGTAVVKIGNAKDANNIFINIQVVGVN